MKTLVKIAAVALVSMATLMGTSCSKSYNGKVELKNNIDSVSYALGAFSGANLRQMLIRIPFIGTDSVALAKVILNGTLHDDFVTSVKEQLIGDADLNETAFRHGFAHKYIYGEKTQLSESEANAVCQKMQSEMRKAKEAKRAAKEAEYREADKIFLSEEPVEGVVVLPNGLKYKVVTSGNGASPVVAEGSVDRVKCHYEGRNLEGQIFDSSYERNQPAVFPLDGVIKGWTEILQLMKEGDKWTVYIPSELAYGERGQGPKIGPNSPLVFDIELIEVLKAQKAIQ